jgi:hypothetical protein
MNIGGCRSALVVAAALAAWCATPASARDAQAGRPIAASGAPGIARMLLAQAQPSAAAPAPDAAHTDRIRIDYVPPKNPAHQKIYELVKERRALETLQQIFAPFRYPLDVTIRTTDCGVSNAWYQRTDKKPLITLCYEYLQEISDTTPEDTSAGNISRREAVIAQFFFAACHELGHASFDLLDVPIWGHEEDAADEFATYLLLAFGGERSRDLINGTAYSYAAFIKGYKNKPNVTLPLQAFSSNHGSPEERFYNLMCIAYGSDDKLFGYTVEKGFLPQSRAKSCRYEYENLKYSFDHTIKAHIDMDMARKVLAKNWFTEPAARPAPQQ